MKNKDKNFKECLVRLPNESFFEKLRIDLSKFSPEKEFKDEIFGWYKNLYISIKK